MENIKNNISKEKLFDYCNGICTEDDINEIEKALSQSEELRAEVDNIRIVLALDTDIREYQAIDTDSAFEEVWGKVDKRKHSFRIDSLMRYAAILSIPLLISTMVFGYLYFSGSEKDSMAYAEVFTSPGTITRYELPDKTVVWLNSDSKLRYPSRFDSAEREVYLEGEAYFEVHADKKHPFYVNMNNGMRVYAYGTKFNVNTYDEENYIETVLEEGKLNVIAPDNETTVVLSPNERLLYNKDTRNMTKEEVYVYEKIAWKDGKLIFRNTTLEDILDRLEKAYNVEITLDNKSNKEYRYRATFTNESITQIFDYLSKSIRMKWEIEEPIQKDDSSFTRKRIHVTLY